MGRFEKDGADTMGDGLDFSELSKGIGDTGLNLFGLREVAGNGFGV